tara:strand:- start:199 stop:303 length:105 start_codon:yes stop_codon:yes gene_type:complete
MNITVSLITSIDSMLIGAAAGLAVGYGIGRGKNE